MPTHVFLYIYVVGISFLFLVLLLIQEFSLDHPSVYIITHQQLRGILFISQFADE